MRPPTAVLQNMPRLLHISIWRCAGSLRAYAGLRRRRSCRRPCLRQGDGVAPVVPLEHDKRRLPFRSPSRGCQYCINRKGVAVLPQRVSHSWHASRSSASPCGSCARRCVPAPEARPQPSFGRKLPLTPKHRSACRPPRGIARQKLLDPRQGKQRR